MMKKTLLALAMLGSFGAATNAQAYAYAVSYNEISNFVITGTNITILNPVTNNSNALACLGGSCVIQGGPGFQNTPPAQIGLPGYVDNTYILPVPTTHEASPTSFSVADADITSTAGVINSARNFTEAKLMENSSASGIAGNSSIQSIVFTVNAVGSLLFEFDATPYIRAFLSPGNFLPTTALGSLSMNINIVGDQGNTDAVSRGLVFNWAPDGIVIPVPVGSVNVLGGRETLDSFSINTSVTATPIAPAPLDYNPTQCATGPCFSASTSDLAAGVYTLNVVMNERDDLLLVPEPGSIMLLGIGLAALGGFTRRRSMRPALPA
jgi:hypothetical protein